MCLVSSCNRGRPNFSSNLIAVTFIVQFVVNTVSEFVLSHFFSYWPFVIVALWIFCNVQLNSDSQSIPSCGFMSSRSVINVVDFFLIFLFSLSIVMVPMIFVSIFSTSHFFLVFGYLLLFFTIFFRW